MKQHRPSNTALIVAAGVHLAREDGVLSAVTLRFGDQLLRRAYPRLAGLLGRPWFRRLCNLIELATLPGICLHFALRKQDLRRHAHAAIDDGCTQVVVLGAGLDTLCMELKAAHPKLCCIEIDHPATQAVKRVAAGDKNIRFIAADFTEQRLDVALRAHPDFREDAPTLFVAEGLLMYMPLAAVRTMFVQLASAALACLRIKDLAENLKKRLLSSLNFVLELAQTSRSGTRNRRSAELLFETLSSLAWSVKRAIMFNILNIYRPNHHATS